MNIHTPQIIMIVLMAIHLGSMFTLDGKEKTGKHNFHAAVFESIVITLILWWGGFYG